MFGSPSEWDRSKRKKAAVQDDLLDILAQGLTFPPSSGSTQTTSSIAPTNTSTSGTTTGGVLGSGLFNNLGGSNTQQGQNVQDTFAGLGVGGGTTTTGSGLAGNLTASVSQSQPGGLFSGLGGTSAPAPNQSKPVFGGFGGSTTGVGLFDKNQSTGQPQQQQQQRPTLSLFNSQNAAPLQHPQPSTATSGLVVPGVQVDVSNLLPTTKFESCSEEIRREIEMIDVSVLYQIQLCNEVSTLVPLVSDQGSTIPNDVEFVQGKLDTIQHALENDASDIDNVRQLVSRDAAEAQVGFRAIDNLKLPLQYQSTSGGWWSVPDQQLSERQSLRSTIGNRKRTLALPDDVEADPSTATSVNGVPVNLVDYFSQRSDEMLSVLDGYKRNLKDIEDHLHSIEITVNKQINEFVASRSRDGAAGNAGMSKSQLNELTAALEDVEAGILNVASRLGGAKEQVQELVLGPVALGSGRHG
ncbi:hypothetical protein Egran_05138 [Elaphomyces granulatus]|uniref:Nucleoporin NUP49/NSP49 n=1 Tax=Elaphomyces granulatus TaxID=519963 RepID=A0A232LSJ5_9EURO|nr:hypothetical protein Egran_05138 [Elaphomyces granulatus]